MAELICKLTGVRGREMELYDTKVVISTKKTIGSLITQNFTDGRKTIYLCDVVGVQFKQSGTLIGYLQFETPAMQMNNANSNFFSENTFTFEAGAYGITNELMAAVYQFVTDRIEELKYNTKIIDSIPDFESMKNYIVKNNTEPVKVKITNEEQEIYENDDDGLFGGYIDIECPSCGEILSVFSTDTSVVCPWCNENITLE